MKFDKIKTEWASLKLTENGPSVMAIKARDAYKCICFEDAQTLRDALNKKRISVKKWAIAVPSDVCIFKIMDLPAASLAEAHRMIEFELSSVLPIPPENLVYGSTLLRDSDNLLSVLVCIIKTDILQKILEPHRSIGIHPDKVLVDAAAQLCWFNSISGHDKNTCINALLNKTNCELTTSFMGRLCSFEKIDNNNGNINVILKQFTSVIIHRKKELFPLQTETIPVNFAATKKIVEDIKNFLKKDNHINLGTINLFEYPQCLSINNKTEYQTDSTGYTSAIAEGLLRSATDKQFDFLNLLPEKVLKKAKRKALLTKALVTVGLSILLIFVLWSNFVLLNRRIEKARRMVQAKIAPIEDIAKSVEGKRQQVKAIQRQLSNRDQINVILEELYKYSPVSISISELKFTSDFDKTTVTIKGQADSLSNAFEYSQAMKDANLLSNIQIINAQQIPTPGGSVVEFRASCVIDKS